MRAHLLSITLFALTLATATATASHVRAASVVEPTTGCVREMAAPAATHRAALVVTFGDRHTKAFCIEFAEDSITGVQLLQRSGLPLVTSGSGGLGAAVCAIDGEGSSDPTNCFASCTGGSCAYWAYYRYVDGKWAFSQAGGSQTSVHDGDVQGWAWGPGGVSAGAVPEPPGEICPASIATATSTAVLPAATATPQPPEPQTTTPAATIRPEPSAMVESTASPIEPGTGATAAAPTAQPPQAGTPAPEASVQSIVEGVAAQRPALLSPTAIGTSSAASNTPRSGAIIVGQDQANRNEASSESKGGGGSGSRSSIVAFAFVAVMVAGIGGVVLYRRRHAT